MRIVTIFEHPDFIFTYMKFLNEKFPNLVIRLLH